MSEGAAKVDALARTDVAALLDEAVALGGPGKPILALPDPDDARAVTLAHLDRVAGVVFATREQVPSVMPKERAGWLRRPPYAWTLPAARARWALFAGPRRRIARPMLQTALRHGVRRIVYAGPRGLKAESVAAMLARRGLEVVLHHVARRLPALDRLEGRALERIVAALLGRAPAPAAGAARRILLTNHSLGLGGAERQIVNTLLGLKARGFGDLALACERRHSDGADDEFGRLLEARGIAIAEVPGRPVDDRDLPPSDGLPHSLGDDMQFWAALIRSYRPSVLHAWQDTTAPKAGLAAALAGVPRIVLATRNRAPWRFAYWLPWMRPVYRALAARPNVVLTNNSRAGARDYERWLGLPEGRIHVIYNALAPDALAPPAGDAVAALRARLGIPDAAPVVGSMFRIYPEKNPALWIATAAAVAARNPGARFLLVGDGPLKGAMQAAALRAGIADRVIFAGEVADPRAALAAMDVFLLTSREEGLPNVVIEAQAQRVPVVATAAGGVPEAVEDGRSGFVAAADANALAQAVLRVLGDRAWAVAARAHAPSFVAARFGVDRMLDETLRLYGFAP